MSTNASGTDADNISALYYQPYEVAVFENLLTGIAYGEG